MGRLLAKVQFIGRRFGEWSAVFLQPMVRSSIILFDLFEFVRSKGSNCFIGMPSRDIIRTSARLPQHPRFLGYWYDAERHSAIGMHVGVDLIKHQGRFYINEVNLDAAMRPVRRCLYDTEIDPVLTGLCRVAQARRFRRIVLCAGRWRPFYRKEAEMASRQHGLEVVLASTRPWQDPDSLPMPGLPTPLERNTLYVIFSMRHTPIDYLVHDKLGSDTWLSNLMREQSADDQLVSRIRTSRMPFAPPTNAADPWPNLVIKLAGWGKGLFIVFAKVRDEDDACVTLGLTRDGQIPRAMGQSARERLLTKLQHKGPVLYQEYIRPETTEIGKIQTYRLHMFVSPLEDRYLSVHGSVSSISVPKNLPFGIVTDPRAYMAKFAHDAQFVTVDKRAVTEIRRVATRIGKSLQYTLTKRFEIEPRQKRSM